MAKRVVYKRNGKLQPSLTLAQLGEKIYRENQALFKLFSISKKTVYDKVCGAYSNRKSFLNIEFLYNIKPSARLVTHGIPVYIVDMVLHAITYYDNMAEAAKATGVDRRIISEAHICKLLFSDRRYGVATTRADAQTLLDQFNAGKYPSVMIPYEVRFFNTMDCDAQPIYIATGEGVQSLYRYVQALDELKTPTAAAFRTFLSKNRMLLSTTRLRTVLFDEVHYIEVDYHIDSHAKPYPKP